MAAGTPWLVTAKALEGSDLAGLEGSVADVSDHAVPGMAAAVRRSWRGTKKPVFSGAGRRKLAGQQAGGATGRPGRRGYRPAARPGLARGTLAGAPGHAAGQGGPAPAVRG